MIGFLKITEMLNSDTTVRRIAYRDKVVEDCQVILKHPEMVSLPHHSYSAGHLHGSFSSAQEDLPAQNRESGGQDDGENQF